MDIVEQGRLYIRAEAPDYYEKTVVWKMADEIERLRSARNACEEQFQAKVNQILGMMDEIEQLREENQELKLQYLSDQGQWIEETGRPRKAIQKILNMQTSEEDGVNKALLILSMSIARAALGEKE